MAAKINIKSDTAKKKFADCLYFTYGQPAEENSLVFIDNYITIKLIFLS